MKQPPYFEAVRVRAAKRWDQLEQDPELAGPWRQLFRQVQSPRHVLSELLQNADDAGATHASVDIQNGVLTFTHNGSDFTEEQFSSLCRFGYSNKRSLHTIGFRGIGFKSVFSLGDIISLYTPTLSVCFDRIRFSEPRWCEDFQPLTNFTTIQVTIRDQHVRRDFEKNLGEWLSSPSSLLFFRHIRTLKIGDRELRWMQMGHGPIGNSEWFALSVKPENMHLVISSNDEDLPDDAVEEIWDERNIDEETRSIIPKCRVDIVLGLEGRLFVILPTGVKTSLPFACNAPFLQDPARTKIKDPEISPTNRWLLKRAGELAASAMIEWLRNETIETRERTKAYDLLPDVDRNDNSLEGLCATAVELAADNRLKGVRSVLSESGNLELPDQCSLVPDTLHDIWSDNQIATFFTQGEGQLLNPHISEGNRKKLRNWGFIKEIGKAEILQVLKSTHLTRPSSWSQLMSLWAFVSGDVRGYGVDKQSNRCVCIVPVQGQNVLYSALEVVRLGEKRLLHNEEDWQFLASRLIVLDPNWPRYLAEKRRVAEETSSSALSKLVENAYTTLDSLGLKEASDASTVFQRVTDKFFQEERHTITECVKLAQIAASLGVKASEQTRFVTRDRALRTATREIIDDMGVYIDKFFDSSWLNEHVLHEAYGSFTSCTKDEWHGWVRSGRSGLTTFVSLQRTERQIYGREKLMSFLKERGCKTQPHFPYVTQNFVIYDWDFANEHWNYWRNQSEQDDSYWTSLLEQILTASSSYWSGRHVASVEQIATNGSRRYLEVGELPPSWITRFRGLSCLKDANGKSCQPAELLRRTPDTESLINVESFVRAEVDNEGNRQLLVLLGVRDTPTGSAKLIDRLRALSHCDMPLQYEVEKWYYQIDRLIGKCSTDEQLSISSAFRSENIVLTSDSKWVNSLDAYIEANDEEVPGVALVHPSVRHLALWRKVGVNDHPTVDIAMKWLAQIRSGEILSQEKFQRVRSLLQRHHIRVWHEHKHWLNLERQWTPVSELSYSLAMQSLTSWKHLFLQVKEQTADLQMLSTELCCQSPFSTLRSLALCVENHLDMSTRNDVAEHKMPWMEALGESLGRIVIEGDVIETERIRKLGRRLEHTKIRIVAELTTVPYLDGLPAGEARLTDALWQDEVLYAASKSPVKLTSVLAEELARSFAKSEIADAIKFCYDRTPAYAKEYMAETFTLDHCNEIKTTKLDRIGALDNRTDDSMDRCESSMGNGYSPVGDEQPESQPNAQLEESGNANQGNGFHDSVAADGGTSIRRDDSRRDLRENREVKASLIERFARINGFKREGESRFYHLDGRRITKVEKGLLFHWELRSAEGELLQYYWVNEHCLQDEPLQIGSDTWTLCTSKPQMCALILLDNCGNPKEYLGQDLLRMREAGQLQVYPARYRLVFVPET